MEDAGDAWRGAAGDKGQPGAARVADGWLTDP